MSVKCGGQAVNMRLAYIALILAGIISAIAFGVRSGFGIYLEPISSEFGFGREVFAFSMALQNLMWGVTQPFVGALADRYGPFKAIAVGTVLYFAGTMILGFSTTPGMFHLGAGVLVGAGLAGCSTGVLLSAVCQIFPAERRSWALGIIGAASSLGQFLIVPIGQMLMDMVGWSQSAMILSLFVLLMLPMGLIFLKAKPASDVASQIDQTVGESLREALAHHSFWFLIAGFFVCGFQVNYLAVHLPTYVQDLGFSAQTGAWALGLVGLFNIIGAYFAGVMGGKFSKKFLLSTLYFARSVIIALFILLPPSEMLIYLFAVAMGLVWLSTVPLTSGLVGFIYGPRYMSMLFGIIFLSHQIGAFLGAWLGGYLFDTTGSYTIVWWISVALGVFAAVIHLPIREIPLIRTASSPA